MKVSDITDIVQLGREKQIIQSGRWLIYKKLGMNEDKVHLYLNSISDKRIKYMHDALHDILNQIDDGNKWLKHSISSLAELTIYIAYNHPDYRKYLLDSISYFTGIYDSTDDEYRFSLIDKKIMEYAIIYIGKKMREKWVIGKIHEEFKYCSNKVIVYYIKYINETINNVKQGDIIKDICAFGLFVCMHDTAYRDPFMYLSWKHGNDELSNISTTYARKPEQWYTNRWVLGKRLTKKLRDEGKIQKYEFSVIEKPCVPSRQKADLLKYLRKDKK